MRDRSLRNVISRLEECDLDITWKRRRLCSPPMHGNGEVVCLKENIIRIAGTNGVEVRIVIIMMYIVIC